jgi:hypothetical protein
VEVGRLDEALEADEAEFFELHLSSRKPLRQQARPLVKSGPRRRGRIT